MHLNNGGWGHCPQDRARAHAWMVQAKGRMHNVANFNALRALVTHFPEKVSSAERQFFEDNKESFPYDPSSIEPEPGDPEMPNVSDGSQ